MADQMTFPDNFKDFIKDYSFKDTKEIYTNGAKLILTFRVEQAWEHYTDIIYNYIGEIRAYLADIIYDYSEVKTYLDTIESTRYRTDDILDELDKIERIIALWNINGDYSINHP